MSKTGFSEIMKGALLGLFLILAGVAHAAAMDFRQAEPGYSYQFPRDHGSHDDFQIEWWYFTGNLKDRSGNRLGYELTFFRTGIQSESVRGNPSRWHVENIYAAHFALTDGKNGRFWFDEKMGREGLGLGGSDRGELNVWIDHWSGRESGGMIHLHAASGTGDGRNEISLGLVSEKKPAVHGPDGTSPKDKGALNRSHYYSMSRLITSGTVIMQGQLYEIEGISWMDHEFGSSPLLASQTGWDWLSLQLENHQELMLYQIRNRDRSPPYFFGSLIDRDGSVITLNPGEVQFKPTGFWKSAAGSVYPVEWTLILPERNIAFTITPLVRNQELEVFGGAVRYWEGAVTAGGSPVSGVGYLELTGYEGDFASLFSQKGQ